MSFGLYALDDSTRKLLDAENFMRPDFSVRGFVEQLATNQEEGSSNKESLDPKPYIRSFEAVLSQLQAMQTKAKKAENDALTQVKSSETNHSRNIIALNRSMESVTNDFTSLSGTITDIASSTSTLTDRLERLSTQLEQAQSSHFLITCFLSFCQRGSCSELEKMWEIGGLDSRRKCANTVGQLQYLAKKVNYNDKSQEEIDKLAERIEKDLLEQFDDAYRAADLSIMRECADLAYDFNGGDRVVQIFVNQHEFFILQDKLSTLSSLDPDNSEYWDGLVDPTGDYSAFDGRIREFVDEIKDGASLETEIIRKVFRNPVDVLRVFLQRTFAQRVQQQMETILGTAENLSNLAYLRVLHVFYLRIGGLNKSLKDIVNKADMDNDGVLSILFDQNYTDLFIPYIENARYFDTEKRNLQDMIEEAVQSYNNFQLRKQGRDQTFMGRFRDTGSKEYTNHDDEKDKESGKGRIGQLMRAVKLERSNSNKTAITTNNQEIPSAPSTPTLDGNSNLSTKLDFSVDNVQRILGAFAEAIRRVLEFANGQEVKNDAAILFHMLCEGVLKRYIEGALTDAANSAYSTNESIPAALQTVSQACISTQLVTVFIKKVLVTVISGSEPLPKTLIDTINTRTRQVEEKCNLVLRNSVDSTISKVSQLLSKQKKRDFLPKSDDLDGSIGTNRAFESVTGVCSEIKQVLSSIQVAVEEYLDGGNAEQFSLELGNQFRELLLKHIKKFTYSPIGGRILSHDLQAYQEVIDDWSISDLSASFTLLHSIANLYTAETHVLPSLLRGSSLAQLKPMTIREYLSKRQDYSSISKFIIPDLFPRTNRAMATSMRDPKSFIYSYPIAF